jgi:site-specific DNA-methyltransferase (adenine-specific)
MEIVNKAISEIVPYDKNPRKHKKAVDYVASSISEFGFKVPIVIDKNNVIVCGHTRLLAAKKLKLDEVPCVVADDLTEEQIKAFRLADNKVSEFAEWDFDLLTDELKDILDIDMGDFGFDLSFDEDTEEIEEDEAPENVETRCKLGDMWQLGEHRLICGDSTDINVVDRLVGGQRIDMLFTDPPYNMSDHLTGFANEKTKKALSTIVDFDPNTVVDTLFAINTNNYFIFTSKELIPKYFKIFEEWGFNILVWCKDNPTPMTNNTFLPDVEYLLYFYKNGRVWNNGLDISVYKKYYNSNKMEGRKEAGNVHPTIKPIKIIADKIQICSNKNGIVVDLFGGSGSTLIACEQLNRKCFMVELDPHYCDVIITRWENLTGQTAVLLD